MRRVLSACPRTPLPAAVCVSGPLVRRRGPSRERQIRPRPDQGSRVFQNCDEARGRLARHTSARGPRPNRHEQKGFAAMAGHLLDEERVSAGGDLVPIGEPLLERDRETLTSPACSTRPPGKRSRTGELAAQSRWNRAGPDHVRISSPTHRFQPRHARNRSAPPPPFSLPLLFSIYLSPPPYLLPTPSPPPPFPLPLPTLPPPPSPPSSSPPPPSPPPCPPSPPPPSPHLLPPRLTRPSATRARGRPTTPGCRR